MAEQWRAGKGRRGKRNGGERTVINIVRGFRDISGLHF
jgi:hypothetical protein